VRVRVHELVRVHGRMRVSISHYTHTHTNGGSNTGMKYRASYRHASR